MSTARQKSVFSPTQVRAARGLLNCSARRLAELSKLEPEAVHLFETGAGDLSESELQRLGAILRGAGVVPIAPGYAGEGVRFRGAPEAACHRSPRTPCAPPPRALPNWLPLGLDDEPLDPLASAP